MILHRIFFWFCGILFLSQSSVASKLFLKTSILNVFSPESSRRYKSLPNRANSSFEDEDGRNELHHAADKGDLKETVRHLAKKVDPNAQDNYGLTPLHVAAIRGHVSVLCALLKHNRPNLNDDTPALLRDIRRLVFSTAPPVNVNAVCHLGQTALHCAVINGQPEIVQLLLEHDAIANLPDIHGRTALHYAAIRGNVSIADTLMNPTGSKRHTANPSARDEDGMEAIHYAAMMGKDLLIFLLTTGNLNARDCQQRAPLHHAALCDNTDAINVLLDNDVDINVVDCIQCTPLMLACQRGHTNTVALLLARGAHTKIADAHGRTPLHHAAQGGKVDVASQLVAKNLDDTIDSDGMTSLHHAVLNGHAHMAVFLKSQYAVNTSDCFGMTPMNYAIMSGNDTICAAIGGIQNTAHRMESDQRGRILGYMAANGHTALVRRLLASGVSHESRDTALRLAARHGHEDVMAALLDDSAPIDPQSAQMETLLHCAILNGHLGCVQLLLWNRVTLSHALDCAVQYGHRSITSALLEHSDRSLLPLVQTAVAMGHTAVLVALLRRATDFVPSSPYAVALLHAAASNGHTETVSVLLHRGVSVDAEIDMMQPIHKAAAANHHQTVKILLENNANPHAPSANYHTPLHLATCADHLQTVKILVKHGASPCSLNANNLTPIECAAELNLFETFKFLLEACTKSYFRERSLHFAAKFGRTELIQLILPHYAFVDATAFFDLNTALHCAAENGHDKTVSALLSNGAAVNIQNSLGKTPLHLATEAGHDLVVQVLLEAQANTEIRDNATLVPLHCASKKGHCKIVLILLKLTEVNVPDCSLKTPLHYAAENGHTQTVDLLLDHSADINAQSYRGMTALYFASWQGHCKTVMALLRRGAGVNIRDNYREAPLEAATTSGHAVIVTVLITHGAEVNYQRENGQTPLHLAVLHNRPLAAAALLEGGADATIRDDFKHLPIHMTFDPVRSAETIKVLLKHCYTLPDVSKLLQWRYIHKIVVEGDLKKVEEETARFPERLNDRDIIGAAPLQYAAYFGHVKIVKHLLENGANPFALDCNRQTPLHNAARNGHVPVIELFAAKKLSLTELDSNGLTPFFLAAQNGHFDAMACFMRHSAGPKVGTDAQQKVATNQVVL